MDSGTAAVAILVAVISAGTAFAGGYLGSRWKASTDLAQWRRDRLLQFCADFVAAGDELAAIHEAGPGQETAFPAANRRFDQALACVLLVGGDVLDDSAFEYRHALIRLRGAAPGESKLLGEVTHGRARFLAEAHFLLLNLPMKPPWWGRAWSRLAGLITRTKKPAGEGTSRVG